MEHVRRFAGDYETAKDSYPGRISGTGLWLYSDPKFKAWRHDRGACLFHLIGHASCGKSVLTKSLVDEDLAIDRRTYAACYFFFTAGTGATTTASQVMAALLHQLYTQSRGLGNDLDDVLDPVLLAKGPFLESYCGAIWANVLDICDHVGRNITCVLDGLDECNVQARDVLLNIISTFYSSSRAQTTPVRFFITSRSEGEIRFTVEPSRGINSFALVNADDKLDAMAVEMNRVMRLKMRRTSLTIPEEVQDAIIVRLKSVKNRTYRWLDFVLDSITAGSTRSAAEVDLDDVFDEMPRSVEGFYENVLDRSPNRSRTRTILTMVMAAAHPMTLQEIQVASSLVERTHDSLSVLQRSIETDDVFRHELERLCGLTVEIDDGKVQFSHRGVRAYLLQDVEQSTNTVMRWKNSISLTAAHCQLALACFRFLHFFEAIPFPFSEKTFGVTVQRDARTWMEGHRFLEYAAGFWPLHYRGAGSNHREELLPWLPNLLSETLNRHCTWISAHGLAHDHSIPYTVELLLFLARCNLEDCVERLLDSDKTVKPYVCVLAVWYATDRGNKTIVRLVLEYLTAQNFNALENVLDLQYTLAQPLRVSAKQCELEIFEMIIKFLREGSYSYSLDLETLEAILDTQNDANLQRVLEFPSGVNVTVDRLIDCLRRASSRPTAVELILRYKVQGSDLSQATWQRLIEPLMGNLRKETVMVLIDDFPDFVGVTWQALMTASVHRNRSDILRLLVGTYSSHADLYTYGQALITAATLGSEEGLQELLRFHHAELDQNKITFQKAFDCAAEESHYGAMELLLTDGRLGKYAGISHMLYKAAVDGCVDPTQSLLDHIKRIQLEHADDLHLALEGAAANGRKETTAILLRHCQQCDSLPENCYRSALNNAARNDHDDVVQLLLDQGPSDLSSRHAAFFRDTGEEDPMDLHADNSKSDDAADEPLFNEDELDLDGSDDDEIMHEGSDISE